MAISISSSSSASSSSEVVLVSSGRVEHSDGLFPHEKIRPVSRLRQPLRASLTTTITEDSSDIHCSTLQASLSTGPCFTTSTVSSQSRANYSRVASEIQTAFNRHASSALTYEQLISLDDALDSTPSQSRGAPPSIIKNLPVYVTAACDHLQLSCCICLCAIKKDEIVRKLNCSHTFHKSCIDRKS